MQMPTFSVQNGEFPVKVKDIPKFGKLKNLHISVFELTGTVLIPVYFNKNYLQP